MKITRNCEETICGECGALTVEWAEERVLNGSLESVPCKRDYYPITFAIRLKRDTATTYIVTPELERVLRGLPYSRIFSSDAGKLNYAVVVSLPKDMMDQQASD
jgi:hypothetical protein